MFVPGTRFAATDTWRIDVNDYGDHFYHIYHVVSSTDKSLLLLSATLFSGDIHVKGNELMDNVVQAYKTKTPMLNTRTTPRRYMLKKDKHGDFFVTGMGGTASRRVRINGTFNPVQIITFPSNIDPRPD